MKAVGIFRDSIWLLARFEPWPAVRLPLGAVLLKTLTST
jgi:hypothetical protein